MSGRAEDIGGNLERFLQGLSHHIPLLEADLSHIKKFCRGLYEKRRLNKEIEDLTQEIGTLKETRRREKESEQYKKDDYKEKSRETEDLRGKVEELESVNQKIKEDISILIAEKRSLKDAYKRQELQIKSLEKEIDDKKQRTDLHNKEFQNKITNLRIKLEDTEKELEDTKLRLSTLMGNRLSENNPNIADLSDQRRPTKLAEMFSSLYDDEYSNAFEEINTGKRLRDEKEICQTLLDILMEAHMFCEKKAEEELNNLERRQQFSTSLHNKTRADFTKKEMKELLKKKAEKSVEAFFRDFTYHMKTTRLSWIFKYPSSYGKTSEYAKKCVELCSFMAVHDPSLVFGRLPEKDDPLDTQLYRGYKTSGPWVDFTVWPVLYLYENGPMLCKGVVESIQTGHKSGMSDIRDYEGRESHNKTELRDYNLYSAATNSARPKSAPNIYRSLTDDVSQLGHHSTNLTDKDFLRRESHTHHTRFVSPGYRQFTLQTYHRY